MDLDLFDAFEETASTAVSSEIRNAVSKDADLIQYVPKSKRHKKEDGAVAGTTHTVDTTSSLPALDTADLPVFTNELITKTDTGNTLKQVLPALPVSIDYLHFNLRSFCLVHSSSSRLSP